MMPVLLAFLLMGDIQVGKEIRKAEKLTDAEMVMVNEADYQMAKAESDRKTVLAKIAANHGMSNQRWPEWECYYEVSGRFIVEYFVNHMNSYITFTPNTVTPGSMLRSKP